MSSRLPITTGIAILVVALLGACSSVPPAPPTDAQPPAAPERSERLEQPVPRYFQLEQRHDSRELVMFALGLLGTGYRFGGRNPDAGLDCSGMVSYIVEQVSGQRLPHNAARIAEVTRPIELSGLQPGDLVFFNTRNRRHSHMGIYVGDGKFVHAPSSRGRVRVERLDNPYFAPRIDGARSLLAAS
jgi:cell wall-associated NlpC family hydrolase